MSTIRCCARMCWRVPRAPSSAWSGSARRRRRPGGAPGRACRPRRRAGRPVRLAWARGLRGQPIDDICARFDKASPTPAHLSHSPRRVAGQRLVWRGRLHAARTFLTRLLALADERGEAGSYAFCRLHLCELALRAGAWAEASRLLEEWSDSAEREFLLPPMYERSLSLLASRARRRRRGRAVGGRSDCPRAADGRPVG